MNNINYKSNNNIVYSCKYHVVWCPKYRRKVLVGKIEKRLKEVIKETCAKLSVEIIEMELMPDHVHLLLEVDPQFGIHKAIKRIKGVSSRILRQEFKELCTNCICPPKTPICICGHKAEGKLVNKKPIIANDDELNENSRASCAKLRILEKI